MSKLKLLLPALLLGAPSTAMAAHRASTNAQVTYRARSEARFDDHRHAPPRRDDRRDVRFEQRFGDHDDDRSSAQPRYRPSWVAFTTPLSLGRGGVTVEPEQRGTFSQLRVQSQSGLTYVDAILIRFRDGSEQRLRVGRVLSGHDDMAQLDLTGGNRAIQCITVLGDGRRGGTVQVYGI